jgi:C-terminal, D2-small domain, of ClpB protein
VAPQGFDPVFGARPVKRAVSQQLVRPASRAASLHEPVCHSVRQPGTLYCQHLCNTVDAGFAQETSIAKALLRGDFGEEDVVNVVPVSMRNCLQSCTAQRRLLHKHHVSTVCAQSPLLTMSL